jgi:uncharacterized membrane protein YccF (DUF307 family)
MCHRLGSKLRPHAPVRTDTQVLHFGVAALRIGIFALWPFGKTVVRREDAGAGTAIGNVIWLVLAGWWLALGHVLTAIPLAITIIGIPFAWAHLKLALLSLWPVGRTVVNTHDAILHMEWRPGRRAPRHRDITPS